jgi:hypothetical protein
VTSANKKGKKPFWIDKLPQYIFSEEEKKKTKKMNPDAEDEDFWPVLKKGRCGDENVSLHMNSSQRLGYV